MAHAGARERRTHGARATPLVHALRQIGRGHGARRASFAARTAERIRETRSEGASRRCRRHAAARLVHAGGLPHQGFQHAAPRPMASDQHRPRRRADHVRGGFRRARHPRPAHRRGHVEPRTVRFRLLGHLRRGADAKPRPVLLRPARPGQKLLREGHRRA